MKYSNITCAVKLALTGAILTSNIAIADDEKIETITVTGQKIDRSLQETPASVAVVTNQQIEQQNLIDMFDVLEQMPNVSGDLGGGFTIRGIDAFNVSGGGNSFLTSVYVDGAILPRRMIEQGGFSAWDVEQVEVLRGPQSTLQGRNALAGAIVMRTTRPTYEWQGKARLAAGEYGRRDAAVAVGGELVDNQVAFRFSGEKNSFDGFNYNVTRNEDSDFNDNETYRLKFLYEPQGVEDLSFLFSYTYNESEIGPQWTQFRENVDLFENRRVFFNDPIIEFTKNNIYNLEVDYDIDEYWSLASVTTHINAYYGYVWDNDTGPQPLATQADDRSDDTFSQELRFIYQGDDLQAVFGAYYTDLDVNDDYAGTSQVSLSDAGIPRLLVGSLVQQGLPVAQANQVANQILTLYRQFDPALTNLTQSLQQSVASAALYADFTYQLNDHWRVFGGLRYDREEQENATSNSVEILNQNLLPNPQTLGLDPLTTQIVTGLNGAILQNARNASGNEPLTDETFSAWLPKLGVTYLWNDDLSAHFTYQKGYRSGGVGFNIARSEIFTYDQEYTDNYELSLRSVWLDGTLVANANVFYLDWTDQQVNTQLSSNRFDRVTENVGSSNLKGFEVEVFYHLNDQWRLTAGVGLAKSEFDQFIVAVPGEPIIDLSGRTFGGAPEWTANFALNYDSGEGLFGNINANFANSHDASNNPYRNGLTEGDEGFDPQNDARILVNARLGYNWENWGVFASVTNLFDKDFIDAANINRGRDRGANSDNQGSQVLGEPRQVSLNLTYKF
ncbi:TonB-dependent receptor [Endozoicomonas sp. G2_1]|uniref:TonB-dependent receptor n=1 Tax=Endozoicomonas sp. G2_1 TaxID=2821091 RepID=UPI001ADADE74|nr:TonB-dependent receptor [Endozoicomonas sp. G2_1]MBO9489915.1 TonB-dependent receptor [Endozoicomonas sp. G2_1]